MDVMDGIPASWQRGGRSPRRSVERAARCAGGALAGIVLWAAAAGAGVPAGSIEFGSKAIRLVLTDGRPAGFVSGEGDTLVEIPDQAPAWTCTFLGQYDPVGPAAAPRVREESRNGRRVLLLEYPREAATGLGAVLEVEPLTGIPGIDLRLTVRNESDLEVDAVQFPANLRVARAPSRHLVFPFESGILLPLGRTFDTMRIYGALPFIHGYPGDRASMQWLGIGDPDGPPVLVMSTDRYGGLKRFGAVPEGNHAELVLASHAGLRPGAAIALPAWRIVAIPADADGPPAYERMAGIYRDWVRELRSEDGRPARKTVRGTERIPLQFVGLDAKGKRRVRLDALRNSHGYPEHVLRTHPATGETILCTSYGLAAECLRVFETVYGSKVSPQLWSFSRAESAGGWPLFPHDPLAENPLESGGFSFPGLTLGAFLDTLRDRGDVALLYTNPTFWGRRSPQYRESAMFDRSGTGDIVRGGFAAQASEDFAYVSPGLVREAQETDLRRLAGFGGYPEAGAGGIMFDSSQALGGTLFNNSALRRDPITEVDRNPAARYVERYGYTGRDSYAQDRIQRDIALDDALPGACKTGEWISELTTLYLDLNAGSIDLKREFPDTVPRPATENLIPVPLFQMVYGDAQFFTIRVGAASDATLGQGKDRLGADMSRRATALFGGVHQLFHWGGIPWGGPAYLQFHGRTYLVTRDNRVRRDLFGRRAAYRMLTARGAPTVDNFAVRETRWADDAGKALGLHWDNNSGETAREIASPVLRARVTPLYGSPESLPDSLDRMRAGATLTLTADGRVAAWNWAGTARWGNGYEITVRDSAEGPEGLCVIQDGERLTLGNAAATPREITVVLARTDAGEPAVPAPVRVRADDGTEREFTYSDAAQLEVGVRNGWLTVRAVLPGAPAAERFEIPTRIVTLAFPR